MGPSVKKTSSNRNSPVPRLPSDRVPVLQILLLVVLLFSCGGKKIFVAKSAEEAFEYAMKSYEEEDYQDAVSGFQRVIFNFPGDELVEESMFFLADSYFKDEDYLLAANEFRRVSSEFPDGEFALISQYKLGLCHLKLSAPYQLDQKDTRRAIDSFNVLIDRFPASVYADSARTQVSALRDKLARKEYESGYYYYRRKFYDSAIIYFETMRDNYFETRWMAPALYCLSKAYDELDLPDDAREARMDLLEHFPDTREALKVLEEFPSLAEESQALSQ
jgi:outer membrane protein assembly factor BamD